MGSTLARITDLCSDVAIRFIAPPRRDLNLSETPRKRGGAVAKSSQFNGNLASAYAERHMQVNLAPDACLPIGCADGRGEAVAAFVNDLEAFRLRMLRASFDERVSIIAAAIQLVGPGREAVAVSADGGAPAPAGSTQDEVDRAVRMLDARKSADVTRP